jgi:hypothetical protein
MPRYNPIDIGLLLQARLSDLAALKWDAAGVVADFVLPTDDASLLRVSFNRPCIIRLVDEMALSTEATLPLKERCRSISRTELKMLLSLVSNLTLGR